MTVVLLTDTIRGVSGKHDRTLRAIFADPVRANINWSDVESLLSNLGAEITEGAGSRVRIALNGRGTAVNGPLRNSGGDVEIDGQLDVGAAGTARLEATLRPRARDRERADRIAMTLAALGSPDGQGGYRVIWAGTWR